MCESPTRSGPRRRRANLRGSVYRRGRRADHALASDSYLSVVVGTQMLFLTYHVNLSDPSTKASRGAPPRGAAPSRRARGRACCGAARRRRDARRSRGCQVRERVGRRGTSRALWRLRGGADARDGAPRRRRRACTRRGALVRRCGRGGAALASEALETEAAATNAEADAAHGANDSAARSRPRPITSPRPRARATYIRMSIFKDEHWALRVEYLFEGGRVSRGR